MGDWVLEKQLEDPRKSPGLTARSLRERSCLITYQGPSGD